MSDIKKIAADRKPWINQTEPPFIEIKAISKRFDDTNAVDNVSIDIYKGEFFALLGGSGSGKSTLLRILAGLEYPDQGDIIINGKSILSLPANKRPINMMFQSYALFPHMSVAKNISFGLEQEKLSKAEISERTAYYIHLVQLEQFTDRKPDQLSGGQKQRVALARCLIKQPELILLDEPLAALDHKLREQTQFELVALQEKLNLTMLVVTHDQKEAMGLSTRIGVMQHGHIIQIGEPAEIYNQPINRFVANFIGNANFFDATVSHVDATNKHYSLECDFGTIVNNPIVAVTPIIGQKVQISIRPEHIRMHKASQTIPASPDILQFNAIVEDVAFMGDHSIYRIKLANGQICMVNSNQDDISWDEEIVITWKRSQTRALLN